MVEINERLYLFGGVGTQLSKQVSEYSIQDKKWKHLDEIGNKGRYL
jgi:hypothetical protein